MSTSVRTQGIQDSNPGSPAHSQLYRTGHLRPGPPPGGGGRGGLGISPPCWLLCCCCSESCARTALKNMLLLCSFVHSTLSPSRELPAPHLPSLHLPRALPSSSPIPRVPLLALTPLSATRMRHRPPARGCWRLAVTLVLTGTGLPVAAQLAGRPQVTAWSPLNQRLPR